MDASPTSSTTKPDTSEAREISTTGILGAWPDKLLAASLTPRACCIFRLQARKTPRGRGGYRRLSGEKNTSNSSHKSHHFFQHQRTAQRRIHRRGSAPVALALSFLTFECWPIGQNLGISKSRSSGFPRERRTTDLNSTGPACSISAVGRSLGNLQPRDTRPPFRP